MPKASLKMFVLHEQIDVGHFKWLISNGGRLFKSLTCCTLAARNDNSFKEQLSDEDRKRILSSS